VALLEKQIEANKRPAPIAILEGLYSEYLWSQKLRAGFSSAEVAMLRTLVPADGAGRGGTNRGDLQVPPGHSSWTLDGDGCAPHPLSQDSCGPYRKKILCSARFGEGAEPAAAQKAKGTFYCTSLACGLPSKWSGYRES
jgi:hypothetical protein